MASADLDRLRMIVTGGASGIGLAVTEAALARGATVCVLDLDPTNTPSGATGIVTDVADDESAAAAVAHAAEAMDGIDIVVNNAGIGAQGTVETNTDRRVAPRLRRQRVRHRSHHTRRAAPPPTILVPGGGQHVLDRGDSGPPRAGAVQRDQRRRALTDAGDGRRPRRRRHPRQLRQPRDSRHAMDRPIARQRRRSGAGTCGPRSAANRWAGWSPPKRWRPRSSTSHRQPPAPQRARRWRSTVAWPDCACDPRGE